MDQALINVVEESRVNQEEKLGQEIYGLLSGSLDGFQEKLKQAVQSEISNYQSALSDVLEAGFRLS